MIEYQHNEPVKNVLTSYLDGTLGEGKAIFDEKEAQLLLDLINVADDLECRYQGCVNGNIYVEVPGEILGKEEDKVVETPCPVCGKLKEVVRKLKED